MNYEEKFGKLLLHCTASSGQTLKKRLLFLVPAIILIVGGAIALLAPDLLTEDDDDIKIAFAVFIALGVMLLLWGVVFVKRAMVELYETGYVLTRGSKVTVMAFDDVKGISDSTTAFSAYGIIPVGKSRDVSITKKDGVPILLLKSGVPNFNQFVDELGAAFTEYLLKDLTKENIGQASISFGNKLELAGGHLVFDAGGKKAKSR